MTARQTADTPRTSSVWHRSIRLRLLVLVLFIVMATIAVMAFLALQEVDSVSVFHLTREMVLVADVLEAAMLPALTPTPDVPALQALVDRVVASRKRNDVELNVILLKNGKSSIVASNIPSNLEETSPGEHQAVIDCLAKGEAAVTIDRYEDRDPDAPEGDIPPSSPDYYIPAGYRFITVTCPLIVDGKPLGAISAKLSLEDVDKRMARIRALVYVIAILLPTVAVALVLIAIRGGLRPLRLLARKVGAVDAENLDVRFSPGEAPVEMQTIVVRLNGLLDRLQAAFERERRFTGHVAHELRTPLATLKAIAETGIHESAKKSADDKYQDFFRDALAVTDEMTHLVAQLLNLVRCEGGRQAVRVAEVALREIVDSAWDAHAGRAREKGLSVEFAFDDMPEIETDAMLLGAVLRNLFDNAVSYTPPGGTIRCETHGSGLHDFQIVVANTSSGLTPEDIPFFCEAFWRKDDARSNTTHSGLGLALVQAYARLLHIRLAMDMPAETTFRVLLTSPHLG